MKNIFQMTIMIFTILGVLTTQGCGGGGGDDEDNTTPTTDSSQQWTWISGSQSTNQSTTASSPGARYGGSSWTDSDGNLWLFGGYGYDASGTLGYLNDLWKHTSSSGTWELISGDTTANQPGEYGTKGTGAVSNSPGSRYACVSWIDQSNNLWLFGGYGYDDASVTPGDLNDLWKFDGTNWIWISGSNEIDQSGEYGVKGTAAASNIPGSREASISWIDPEGANLYLFGGYGFDSSESPDELNDLWRFNLNTKLWTWVSGNDTTNQPGSYGELGVPSTSYCPSARDSGVAWVDSAGVLWLFGGYGFGNGEGTPGALNDLWSYNTSTKEWTWVSGDDTSNQSGTYGTRGTATASNIPGARYYAISWTDSSDNLWLFGGYGFGSSGSSDGDLNDLWKFDGANWTWISGSDVINQSGVYGTQGTAAASNTPGSRDSGVSWIDSSGNLWLFGGVGSTGELNDLWKYEP